MGSSESSEDNDNDLDMEMTMLIPTYVNTPDYDDMCIKVGKGTLWSVYWAISRKQDVNVYRARVLTLWIIEVRSLEKLFIL